MIEGLSLAVVSEPELNEIAEGTVSGFALEWPSAGARARIPGDAFGVILLSGRGDQGLKRPMMIIASKDQHRRLFARFSQLRSDFSPISSWCHTITPEQFDRVRGDATFADLGGLEAAWAGLVVAEAKLLARRPLSVIKLVACLATETFATARALALWGEHAAFQAPEEVETIRDALRVSGGRRRVVREAFKPIWESLISLSSGRAPARGTYKDLARYLSLILDAKRHARDVSTILSVVMRDVPEAGLLSALDSTSPEDRLKAFDKIVERIRKMEADSTRRHELCFLGGYLATIAAGGSSSLSLAEAVSDDIPEVTAWAYVLGSLGERVTWTSGFDGLGRLVVRELMRAFYISEAPVADFAADEANVLIDRGLRDPLVNLRVKQSRVVTVALRPGVNVAIPFADQQQEATLASSRTDTVKAPTTDPWAVIVDALLPHLVPRLREGLKLSDSNTRDSRSGRSSRGRATQRKLSLE